MSRLPTVSGAAVAKEKQQTTRTTPPSQLSSRTQKIVDKLGNILGANKRITRINKIKKKLLAWEIYRAHVIICCVHPTTNHLQKPYIARAKELEKDYVSLEEIVSNTEKAIQENKDSIIDLQTSITGVVENIEKTTKDIENYKKILEEINKPGPSLRDSILETWEGDPDALDKRRQQQQNELGLDALEYMTGADVEKIIEQLETAKNTQDLLIENTTQSINILQNSIEKLENLPSIKKQYEIISDAIHSSTSMVNIYEQVQFISSIGGAILLIAFLHKLLGMSHNEHHQYGLNGERLKKRIVESIIIGLVSYGVGKEIIGPLLEGLIQSEQITLPSQ